MIAHPKMFMSPKSIINPKMIVQTESLASINDHLNQKDQNYNICITSKQHSPSDHHDFTIVPISAAGAIRSNPCYVVHTFIWENPGFRKGYKYVWDTLLQNVNLQFLHPLTHSLFLHPSCLPSSVSPPLFSFSLPSFSPSLLSLQLQM